MRRHRLVLCAILHRDHPRRRRARGANADGTAQGCARRTARLVLEIDRIGHSYGPDGRSNAPHITVYPNVRGVIPSEVKLSCDVRRSDVGTVGAMGAKPRPAWLRRPALALRSTSTASRCAGESGDGEDLAVGRIQVRF